MDYSTRYSERLVLHELRAFARRARRPPRQIDLGHRNKLPSFPVIERLFGSWTGCLKALGYAARVNRHWTKYDALRAIQLCHRFVKQTGRSPKLTDLGSRNQLPSWPVVKRLFGGLNGYREACGYPARWIHKRWTKRELIQIIRNLSSKVKRTPTLLDLQAQTNLGLPNQHVFTRVFGGWDAALRAADRDLDERQLFWRRWQRIVVKAAIALYGRENIITGKVHGIRGSVDCYVKSHRLVIDAMTSGYQHVYKAGEIPRYTSGQRKLVFWCAHRGVREYKAPRLRYRYASDIAAMLSHKGHTTLAKHVLNYAKGEAALYTDELLLKMVCQLARRLGRTPRLKDFDSDPEMPTGALIFRRFGSLKNACKRAGITYVPSQYSRRYTRNELLVSLKQVWRHHQRPPTVYDFGNIKGRPSVQAIVREFGKWNRGLRAAKIPLNRPGYSNQQMIALYKRVAVRAGQPPSSRIGRSYDGTQAFEAGPFLLPEP